MTTHQELPTEQPGSDSIQRKSGDDLAVFTRIVEALSSVTPDARTRLFRLLATYFDVPLGQNRPREVPSTVEPENLAASAPLRAPFSEDRAPTPKQFMFEKRPLTDVERIACLAYYLTNYRDTPHFKTLELSKLNTEAAQLKFSNAAKAVDNASQRGYLVQAGKGQKQLSALGEAYVEALPDRKAAKNAIAHARPRRSKNRLRNSDVNKDTNKDE